MFHDVPSMIKLIQRSYLNLEFNRVLSFAVTYDEQVLVEVRSYFDGQVN